MFVPRTAGLILGMLLLTESSSPAMPPKNIQEKIDEFAKDEPGGVAVAWVDRQGTTFFETGTFSAADPRKIAPDTQFEIASITKVFTSLLLVESERLGRVARTDPAAKYLLPAGDPDQAALAGITLLSLATHTSGLPRLPSNLKAHVVNPRDPYSAYDRSMLVEALRQDGKAAVTGGKREYSNFGAAVLGEALAAAWGTTYEEALSEHVLVPLGMKAATLGLAGRPAPADLAPGHFNGKEVPSWTQIAFAPAGALRSSSREMALFLSACVARDKGPMGAAIEATLKPQVPAKEIGGQAGLGWLLVDDPAHPLAWHNGGTAGSHSFIAIDRDTGEGIVILANFQKASEKLGFDFFKGRDAVAK